MWLKDPTFYPKYSVSVADAAKEENAAHHAGPHHGAERRSARPAHHPQDVPQPPLASVYGAGLYFDSDWGAVWNSRPRIIAAAC